MMTPMRTKLFLPLMAALALMLPSQAVADEGPVLTLKVGSVDGLIDKMKETAKTMLAAKAYEQFEGQVPLGMAGLIPVLNGSKPAGVYAYLDEGALQGDLRKTYAVVMVPVKSEAETVEVLGGFGIKFEKNAGGYTISHPKVPVPLYAAFADGYVYVAPLNEDAVSAKSRVKPKDFFGESTPIAELKIFVERIPKQLRDMFLQGVDQGLAKSQENSNIPREAKGAMEAYLKWAKNIFDVTFNQGKEIAVMLDLDPKSGLIILENSFTAKSGTDTAKAIKDYPVIKNRFASLAADSIAYAHIRAPLFAKELRELLVVSFEAGFRGEMKKKGEDHAEIAELFLSSIKETVNSGSADFFIAIKPGLEGSQYVVGGFDLKKANELAAAAMKLLAANADASAKAKEAGFVHNPFKVEGLEHTFNLEPSENGKRDPKFDKIFGATSKVSVGVSKDAVFFAAGLTNKGALTEAVKAKPAVAPVIGATLNGKKLAKILQKEGSNMPAEVLDSMEKHEKLALINVSITTGDKMALRVELGTALLAFLGQGRAVPKD
jgi:hypothetical protein